jgi:hypothetical protein
MVAPKKPKTWGPPPATLCPFIDVSMAADCVPNDSSGCLQVPESLRNIL